MKWGIIGTGKIARRFASDLKLVVGAELTGVTSRQADHLNQFCAEFDTNRFASIAELLSSDVEIIYIATPHPSHKEHAVMAIEAGKAVLCEKPFAMNLQKAQAILSLAQRKKCFCDGSNVDQIFSSNQGIDLSRTKWSNRKSFEN